jgi:hypothetical protein
MPDQALQNLILHFAHPRRSTSLQSLFFVDCAVYLSQYSINKSKILLGFAGQGWEDSVVGELDTALNQFIDSLPNHRT